MKSSIGAALCMASLLVGISCMSESETPTQVLVRFAASDALRPLAESIAIAIVDQEGDVVVERTDPVSPGSDLARVPIVPRGGDPTRSFEIVGELLDDEGGSLGFERAVIGFEEDALREVLLIFDESCRGLSDCGEGRRCVLGQCVGACVSPGDTGLERESETACSSCERCSAGRCEPLVDGSACGCTGDVCEGGECLVEQQVRAVALGADHTCAHADGNVYCWGDNQYGQVGVVGAESIWEPVVPLEVDTFIRRVVTAGISTCVLSGSGIRSCFGANNLGQLGKGDTDQGGPEVFTSGEPSLREIDAGGSHFCGLTDSREAWCWGYNTHGQLAMGTDSHHENTPLRSEALDGIDELSTGGFQSCFLSSGELHCVGFNDSGQLGVGDTETRLEPVRPGCDASGGEPCFDDYVQVSTGSFHSCGLRQGGQIHCWGGNTNGQVGIGVVATDELLPVRVGSDSDWTVLSAGFQQTCALSSDGSASCWGAGLHGRLGNGDSDKRSSPTPVRTPEGDTAWVDIATSKTGAHTCAIEGDGSLWCWGNNEFGQLASDPALLDHSPLPRRVCFP